MIIVDHRQLTVVAEPGAAGRRPTCHVTCADPRLPARMSLRAPRHGLGPRAFGRMHEAISRRDGLPARDLEELDRLVVWPLAMVTRDGRGVGWLTRQIDRDYFLEAQPRGGRPDLRLFRLELLCAAKDRLRALGIDGPVVEDDLVRLALMANLAYAVEIIHRPRGGRRIVYGDLSLRGVAVAVNQPRVLLLNGATMADADDAARWQPSAPSFVPPELGPQDQVTDVYKLGLCVIRCLAAGPGATRVADASSPLVRAGLLDRAGVEALNRAVGPDRAERPTAEQLKDVLIGRVLHLAERG